MSYVDEHMDVCKSVGHHFPSRHLVASRASLINIFRVEATGNRRSVISRSMRARWVRSAFQGRGNLALPSYFRKVYMEHGPIHKRARVVDEMNILLERRRAAALGVSLDRRPAHETSERL